MIIHLDLDCYFVSAERTRLPQLKGKPVVIVKSSDKEIFSPHNQKSTIVGEVGAFNSIFQHQKKWCGYSPQGWKKEFIDEHGKIHGICITKSYEAKSYGIQTGMPLAHAIALCPHLHVVCGDHLFYQMLSKQLKEYLDTKIPILEQYSIDEFWGDLSGWIKDEELPSFAKELQSDILKKFDLPISIGISTSKWIAKLATDMNKPLGITFIPKEHIPSMTYHLPVSDFPGVGKALQERFKKYRAKTIGDAVAMKHLISSWGTIGKELYQKMTGNDNEAVIPHHDRRSIGISRNFELIYDREEIIRRTVILARHLAYTVAKIEAMPTTYFFKIRYEGGLKSKVSKTIDRPFSETLLREIAICTIKELDTLPRYGIHHIAMSVSNFATQQKPKIFSLFDHEKDQKNQALNDKITHLRDKFGVDIIRCGVEKRASP